MDDANLIPPAKRCKFEKSLQSDTHHTDSQNSKKDDQIQESSHSEDKKVENSAPSSAVDSNKFVACKSRQKLLKKVNARKHIRKPLQKYGKSIGCKFSKLKNTCSNSTKTGGLANKMLLAPVNKDLKKPSPRTTSLNVDGLMEILTRAEVLSDGQLIKPKPPGLTMSLVMAAVNVFKFSNVDIFSWIISSMKTKYSSFNEKFTKQFEVYQRLYKLLHSNMNSPNGRMLFQLISSTKYSTPTKMENWYILFRKVPQILCHVAVTDDLKNQSLSLNKAAVIEDVPMDGLGVEEDNVSKACPDTSHATDVLAEDVLKNKSNELSVVPQSSDGIADAFVKKVGKLLGVSDFNNESPDDLENLMEKIEKHLINDIRVKKSSGRHQVIANYQTQEHQFRTEVNQLKKTLAYLEEKIVSCDIHLKNVTSKKRSLASTQSELEKAYNRKISFMLSKDHISKHLNNVFVKQIYDQSFHSHVIKSKLLSLEKCYFFQRNQLNNNSDQKDNISPSSVLHESSNTLSVDSSNVSATKASKVSEEENTSPQKTCKKDISTTNNDSLGTLASLKSSLNDKTSLVHSQLAKKERVYIDASIQCNIGNDNCVVLKLPGLYSSDPASDKEISCLLDSAKKSAAETVRCSNSGKQVVQFKNVVDKLILLELLLDNKDSLALCLKNNFPGCFKDPRPLFRSSVNSSKSNRIEVHRNLEEKIKERQFSEGSLDSSSSMDGVPTTVSSLLSVNWNELPRENLEKIMDGLFTFLLDKDGLAVVSDKLQPKLSQVVRNSEDFKQEVKELYSKMRLQQQESENKMKTLEKSFQDIFTYKMQALEQEKVATEIQCKAELAEHLKQYKESLDEYSKVMEPFASELQLLKSYEKTIVKRDELLCQELNAMYESVFKYYPSNLDMIPPKAWIDKNPNLQSKFPFLSFLADEVCRLMSQSDLVADNLSKLTEAKEKVSSLSSCIDGVESQMAQRLSEHKHLKSCLEILDQNYVGIVKLYEEEKKKTSHYKEELQMYSDKLSKAEKMIDELSFSVEAKSTEIKEQDELMSRQIASLENVCKQKTSALCSLASTVFKDKETIQSLTTRLNDALSEIQKLAVIWDVLDVSGTGPTLNVKKCKDELQVKGLNFPNMKIMEELTGWSPKVSDEDGNISFAVPTEQASVASVENDSGETSALSPASYPSNEIESTLKSCELNDVTIETDPPNSLVDLNVASTM